MTSAASVRTRDGLTLHAHHWRPGGATRAGLVLVHGIAEHAARHDHVARRFADAGIETYAADLRGFGRSSGPRAYLDRWSRYHDDLEDQLAGASRSRTTFRRVASRTIRRSRSPITPTR
ncbi:MAG: lysophospholipase [Chloroflexi bacterium]|nr:MAG: lysophospholipase [Chloroflexota bacterium]